MNGLKMIANARLCEVLNKYLSVDFSLDLLQDLRAKFYDCVLVCDILELKKILDFKNEFLNDNLGVIFLDENDKYLDFCLKNDVFYAKLPLEWNSFLVLLKFISFKMGAKTQFIRLEALDFLKSSTDIRNPSRTPPHLAFCG